MPLNVTPSDIARFFAKTQPDGACLLWLPARPDHYGQFWFRGRNVGAHRFAWEVVHGPIPDGLLVLHTCDRPACVSVAHLWVGTDRDNAIDMVMKGRHARMLADVDALAIRRAFVPGRNGNVKALAAQYGVSLATVYAIAAGRSYHHL